MFRGGRDDRNSAKPADHPGSFLRGGPSGVLRCLGRRPTPCRHCRRILSAHTRSPRCRRRLGDCPSGQRHSTAGCRIDDVLCGPRSRHHPPHAGRQELPAVDRRDLGGHRDGCGNGRVDQATGHGHRLSVAAPRGVRRSPLFFRFLRAQHAPRDRTWQSPGRCWARCGPGAGPPSWPPPSAPFWCFLASPGIPPCGRSSASPRVSLLWQLAVLDRVRQSPFEDIPSWPAQERRTPRIFGLAVRNTTAALVALVAAVVVLAPQYGPASSPHPQRVATLVENGSLTRPALVVSRGDNLYLSGRATLIAIAAPNPGLLSRLALPLVGRNATTGHPPAARGQGRG